MFASMSTWNIERLSIRNGRLAPIGMSIVNGFAAIGMALNPVLTQSACQECGWYLEACGF